MNYKILFALVVLLPVVVFGQANPSEKPGSGEFIIVGDVEFPGMYSLSNPTRVFDAIARAGGFRNSTQPVNDTITIRRGDKQIKFDWSSFRQGRGLEQNIFLKDSDVVVVTAPKESSSPLMR